MASPPSSPVLRAPLTLSPPVLQRVSTSPVKPLTTAMPSTITPALSPVSPEGPSPINGSSHTWPLVERLDVKSPRAPLSSDLRGRTQSINNIPSLSLGESTLPLRGQQNAMRDAVSLSKTPGIIRRLSRGAANRLGRRRTSSSHTDRDRMSGPVVARLRSNSNRDMDGAHSEDNADGVESDIEDTVDDPPIIATDPAGDFGDDPTKFQTYIKQKQILTDRPEVHPILRSGTKLTKVTKKKRKHRMFVLDLEAARVSWDASNPLKRFYVDDIQDIRTGANARNYLTDCQVPPSYESTWFTVIYAEHSQKGRLKTCHLIAPDKFTFELWTSTLESMYRDRMNLMLSLAGPDEKAIRPLWRREMVKTRPSGLLKGVQGRMTWEETERICRNMQINCSRDALWKIFDDVDVEHEGSLDFPAFRNFIRKMTHRSDLKNIFLSIIPQGASGLDEVAFLGFLSEVQGIDVDSNRPYWQHVFTKLAKKFKPAGQEEEPDLANLLVTFDGFVSFMINKHGSPLADAPKQLDLMRPLNEYFISSSHNTYLLGRQVAGQSSIEGYIRALQQGCRCVEIDCWDGADGRPVVNHGRTFTTKVLFADVVAAIAKYAFTSSEYPLILSLEVHCCAEQQIVMADILRATLGLQLVTEPEITNALTLPSPEELKNRILVKVKASEEAEDNSRSGTIEVEKLLSPKSRASSYDTSIPSMALGDSTVASSTASMEVMYQAAPNAAASGSSATEDSDNKDGPEIRSRKKVSKIAKPLGDLGVYTRGQKFHNFLSSESKTYNHVFSLAERTFAATCRNTDTKAQLEKHNLRYLMRVYPSGHRIGSSNFDPNLFWRRGVQMVALNWQTYDLGTQMNKAMFASRADRSGYVLKPDELRLQQSASNGLAPAKKGKKLVKFSVEVIAAQRLMRSAFSAPDSAIDPYVEIEVFIADDKIKGGTSGHGGVDIYTRNGAYGQGAPYRRRTATVTNNGFNPVFKDNFTVSLQTKFESLVFVRWTVYNAVDGKFMATYIAKLESLQQGYRHIPLFDSKGDRLLLSTLFCRIRKEPVVLIESSDERIGRVETLKQLGRSVFNRGTGAER